MVAALLALTGGCAPAGEDGWIVLLDGRVVDEGAAPVAEVGVRLSAGTGAHIGETATDADGRWRYPLYGVERVGNVVVTELDAAGYAPARATFAVDLRAPEVGELRAGPWQTWETTSRSLPTQVLAADAELGSARVTVVDARTGDPLAGVELRAQWGWNAPADTEAATTLSTDDEGRADLELAPPGSWTIYVEAAGDHAAARFPAFLSREGGSARGALGPPVEPGTHRASLSWGSTPYDLDLHLSAPLRGGQAGEDGNGRYHVWPGDPQHPRRDVGEDGVEAAVEHTSEAGLGPETVATYLPPGEGELRLAVVDNDHLAELASTALAGAGAVVQLWSGEDEPRYYTVSPGEVGTWWQPMVLDTATGQVYAAESWASGVGPDDPDAF